MVRSKIKLVSHLRNKKTTIREWTQKQTSCSKTKGLNETRTTQLTSLELCMTQFFQHLQSLEKFQIMTSIIISQIKTKCRETNNPFSRIFIPAIRVSWSTISINIEERMSRTERTLPGRSWPLFTRLNKKFYPRWIENWRERPWSKIWGGSPLPTETGSRTLSWG